MLSCLAALLLNVGAEPKSPRSTARVRSFVASSDKLGLLGVVSAVRQLAPNKEGLTN